jgi:hypothetical protein
MNHQISHFFPPLVSESCGRYMVYGNRITDLVIPPTPLHFSSKEMCSGCIPAARLPNCSVFPLLPGAYGDLIGLELQKIA